MRQLYVNLCPFAISQEAGRAGRDGLPSECVMFYKSSDVDLLLRIMKAPPRGKVSKKDADL